jgi:KipI family sensor histidine kinase inhibitor
MSGPVIKITGDTSIAVVFDQVISPKINAQIRALDEEIAAARIYGIFETVPTYCALTIHYDPVRIRYEELRAKIEELMKKAHSAKKRRPTVIEIPVCYGGEFGPDIENVAKHAGISVEEVIKIHTAPEYLIYMLGFTPGFSYMGGMDERIATPRLTEPRVLIPAGSVGIAGAQTGIYPIDSPGGWQLIGRTPVVLYDPDREEPIMLDAGMHVKFVQIDGEEFESIRPMSESGKYKCKTYVRGAEE